MTKFSIDYFNINTFFKTLDYSNKVILNAVTDPLFIYDKKLNDYIPNACSSYKIINNKYYIALRDDLYFSDGTKVTAKEYVEAITENKDLFNLNIISITSTQNEIVITLKNKDTSLKHKLSFYLFSPHKKTSGRYYISKITDKKLELMPNKYYRNQANKKLEFIMIDNLDDNIKNFNNKKLDITNNTFIKLDNNNKKREKSGIIFNLEISSRYNKSIREKIVRSINKNNLVSALGNSYYVKNDFFFNKETKYKFKPLSNNEIIKLKLAYNKFYPNKEIAQLIKKELEKNNYEIELVENIYDDFKHLTSYDIKLTLNYFEYIDDLFFYNSKYFRYIMKNNTLYKHLLRKGYMKKLINKMFMQKYLKEPLLSFYSDYKTNTHTKDYSYLECNYNQIKD